MPKICDPPPFQGGQCVGTSYLIDWIFYWKHDTFAPNGQTFSGGTLAEGKISIADNYRVNSDGKYGGNIVLLSNGNQVRSFGDTNRGVIEYNFSIISITPQNGMVDNCGDPPPTNCRCSDDSCRVDCAGAPDGFCCIDHSLTNRLLQVLQG